MKKYLIFVFIGSIVCLAARFYSIINANRELFSWYNIDLLIIILIIALSFLGAMKKQKRVE